MGIGKKPLRAVSMQIVPNEGVEREALEGWLSRATYKQRDAYARTGRRYGFRAEELLSTDRPSESEMALNPEARVRLVESFSPDQWRGLDRAERVKQNFVTGARPMSPTMALAKIPFDLFGAEKAQHMLAEIEAVSSANYVEWVKKTEKNRAYADAKNPYRLDVNHYDMVVVANPAMMTLINNRSVRKQQRFGGRLPKLIRDAYVMAHQVSYRSPLPADKWRISHLNKGEFQRVRRHVRPETLPEDPISHADDSVRDFVLARAVDLAGADFEDVRLEGGMILTALPVADADLAEALSALRVVLDHDSEVEMETESALMAVNHWETLRDLLEDAPLDREEIAQLLTHLLEERALRHGWRSIPQMRLAGGSTLSGGAGLVSNSAATLLSITTLLKDVEEEFPFLVPLLSSLYLLSQLDVRRRPDLVVSFLLTHWGTLREYVPSVWDVAIAVLQEMKIVVIAQAATSEDDLFTTPFSKLMGGSLFKALWDLAACFSMRAVFQKVGLALGVDSESAFRTLSRLLASDGKADPVETFFSRVMAFARQCVVTVQECIATQSFAPLFSDSVSPEHWIRWSQAMRDPAVHYQPGQPSLVEEFRRKLESGRYPAEITHQMDEHGFVAVMINCVMEGEKQVRKHKDDHSMRTTLQRELSSAYDLLAQWENATPFGSFRIQPLGIFLHGAPGVGKSMLVKPLVDACAHATGRNVTPADILKIDASSNFPDAGRNGQMAVLLDDIDMKDVAPTAGHDTPVDILVKYANNAPLNLEKAAVEDKGTVWAGHTLCFVTSNKRTLWTRAQAIEPDIVNRRLHLYVTVRVKPEFAVGRQVDPAKVAAGGLAGRDFQEFDVGVYDGSLSRPANPEILPYKNVGTFTTRSAFFKFVTGFYVEHLAKQKEAVSVMNKPTRGRVFCPECHVAEDEHGEPCVRPQMKAWPWPMSPDETLVAVKMGERSITVAVSVFANVLGLYMFSANLRVSVVRMIHERRRTPLLVFWIGVLLVSVAFFAADGPDWLSRAQLGGILLTVPAFWEAFFVSVFPRLAMPWWGLAMGRPVGVVAHPQARASDISWSMFYIVFSLFAAMVPGFLLPGFFVALWFVVHDAYLYVRRTDTALAYWSRVYAYRVWADNVVPIALRAGREEWMPKLRLQYVYCRAEIARLTMLRRLDKRTVGLILAGLSVAYAAVYAWTKRRAEAQMSDADVARTYRVPAGLERSKGPYVRVFRDVFEDGFLENRDLPTFSSSEMLKRMAGRMVRVRTANGEVYGFRLKGCLIVTVLHVFDPVPDVLVPRGPPATFIAFSIIEGGKIVDIPADSGRVVQIGKLDLVVLYVPEVLPLKDHWDFPVYLPAAVASVGRSADEGWIVAGSDAKKIDNLRFANVVSGADRWLYDTLMEDGDCGAPVVGRFGGHYMIVGFHQAKLVNFLSGTMGSRSAAVGVTRAEVLAASVSFERYRPEAEVGFSAALLTTVAKPQMLPLPWKSSLAVSLSSESFEPPNVYVLGTLPKGAVGTTSMKTAIVDTWFRKHVKVQALEVRWPPEKSFSPPRFKGKMVGGEWIDPSVRWLRSLRNQPGDLRLVQAAADDFDDGMEELLRGRRCRPLTDYEAITGVEETVIGSINLQTSAGPPFYTKKTEVFDVDHEADPPTVSVDPVWWDLRVKAETALRAGDIVGFLAHMAPKDEVVTIEKNDACKIRLFAIVSSVLNHIGKKFLGPLFALEREFPDHFESVVGMDITDKHTAIKLASSLDEFDPAGDGRLAADAKDYDASQPTVFSVVRAASMKRRALASGYGKGDADVVALLCLAVTYTVRELHGDVIAMSFANPSGSFDTIHRNCWTMSVLFRIAWISGRFPGRMRDFVRLWVCGDDSYAAVRDVARGALNGRSVVAAGSLFGIVLTDAKKRPVMPLFESKGECDFLKRSERVVEGRVVWALDERTFVKMLCMRRRGKVLSDREHHAMILSDILASAWMHGRAVFESYRELAVELARAHGIEKEPKFICRHFDSYLAAYDAGSARLWEPWKNSTLNFHDNV